MEKIYTKEQKEKRKEYFKKWRDTPYGRAVYLISNYKNMDKLKGFSKNCSDLTPQWVIDNILSKPCAHCGETDWHKIGCNRLDNSKPHTMDNVEPCCFDCNVELAHPKKAIAKINPTTKEIVEIYESCMEARRNGYSHAGKVANGERKQEKGYIFKYI